VSRYRALNEGAREQTSSPTCSTCAKPIRLRTPPIEVANGEITKWIQLCDRCRENEDATWRLRWTIVDPKMSRSR
jgi:hypothetical protein